MLAHVARCSLLSVVLALTGCSPSPRPAPEAAPAAPSRGEALVRDRGCASCHQSSDPASGVLSGRTTAIVPGGAYPKNLTPDPETGLGRWTNDAIVRAIREGIDDEGAQLCDAMPRFADLDDADATAIADYLRSLPPVHRAIPESSCADGDAYPLDAGASDDAPLAAGDAAPGDAAIAPPVDTGPPWPAPGEIAITEIMFDPSGAQPDAEWFELHSTCDAPRKLTGLTIASSNERTHGIASPPDVVIQPGGYLLFVRSRAAAIQAKLPGASAAYEYGGDASSSSGVLLANGATGTIAIRAGAQTVVDAPYGAWSLDRRGASIQLDARNGGTGAARDRWCISATPWADGTDLGTPGAPSRCDSVSP